MKNGYRRLITNGRRAKRCMMFLLPRAASLVSAIAMLAAQSVAGVVSGQAASPPIDPGSQGSMMSVKILDIWSQKGIGEPEISASQARAANGSSRQLVCVRFWTLAAGDETRVTIGFELGPRHGRYLPKPPRDCANRRYRPFPELEAILEGIQRNGKNARPFRPGGRRIVVCCKDR